LESYLKIQNHFFDFMWMMQGVSKEHIFLDMVVLIEAQGMLVDNIETHV
jgi:hypothetical protein